MSETIKQQAIRLRQEGHSLNAIIDVVKKPKITVYGWIKSINDVRLLHRIYGALEVYGNVFYHPQTLALEAASTG
jgi:transposase-like protein